ncbi:PAS domain-containing protein, partial [Nostoc sp. NIES-2111]
MSFGNIFRQNPAQDLAGLVAAIERSQARITFSLEGSIVDANANFLAAVGYTLEEIKGKHHSLFVDPSLRDSAEYRVFWDKLRRGESQTGQYRRIANGGRPIWLQASYSPILDRTGKPCKVVKFATDITEQKNRAADAAGQLAAINKAQAVIVFALDGTILDANENFLKTLGYGLEEVTGKHHSMFVEAAERDGPEYKQFWERLRRGEYEARRYKRIGKGGREVWIEASYNPILDADGVPYKIVKFATDVTEQVKATQTMGKVVGAVVEAVKSQDLTARIPREGLHGDILNLCTGINDLLATLTSVISAVRS